jgi:hypothetical protein
VDPDTGRITFYGHDRKGCEIIHTMGLRLKLSNQEREFLKLLISEHLHVLNLSDPVVGSSTRLRWFRKIRDDAIAAIILGMADIKGTLGNDYNEQLRSRHLVWSAKAVADYYGKVKRGLERRNLIGGKDLCLLGVPEGFIMGRVLKRIREAQDQGLILTR